MRSIAGTALAIALLASVYPLASVAQPAPAPTSEPAPATASPAPPPATPTAAPLPSPAPTETPTASPYHFITTPPAPAPGQPAIIEIDLLESTLHAGAPYSVRVKTSLDVTTINVSAMGSTYGMQAAGPGLFASDGQVPSGIPFFLLNRSYTLTLTAQTADGRTTSVPISLRLEK